MCAKAPRTGGAEKALDGKAGGWLMAEEESRLGAGQGTGAALGREDDGVSTAPVQGA